VTDDEVFDLAFEALKHAGSGDIGAASDVLTRVHEDGPQSVTWLLIALSAIGRSFLEAVAGPVPAEAVVSVQQVPGDDRVLDPSELFATRFFGAFLNDDTATGEALLAVLFDQGGDAVGDGVVALLAQTVQFGLMVAQHEAGREGSE
jgi:hypothetical protein